jgi:hypothetical protein
MEKAKLIVTGRPIEIFEFEGLPSVNTHYNMHFRPRSIATKEWRYEAKEKASSFSYGPDDPLIKTRALCIVWVYPPFEEVSDIHNVHIKPVLDGFTDAGVWHDDEWAWVPATMFAWGGIGTQGKRKRISKFEIYELGSFTVNGTEIRLPKGRKRL